MLEMQYQPSLNTPIVLDEGFFYDNVRYLILSYGTHPAAYIEIDLTKYNKEDVKEVLEEDAHEGITFTGVKVAGHAVTDPSRHRWFGWDYAHYDDYVYGLERIYPRKNDLKVFNKHTTQSILDTIQWTIKDIHNNCLIDDIYRDEWD